MNFMSENPKRALLVIDVQNEYFTGQLPITYPAGSLTNGQLHAWSLPTEGWEASSL
jgi:nicotinamidase-related amidase